MAVLTWLVLQGVGWVGLGDGFPRKLLFVLGPGLVGVIVYFWLAARLNISEVRLAVSLVRKRFGGA
jgi:hypothetical protein